MYREMTMGMNLLTKFPQDHCVEAMLVNSWCCQCLALLALLFQTHLDHRIMGN